MTRLTLGALQAEGVPASKVQEKVQGKVQEKVQGFRGRFRGRFKRRFRGSGEGSGEGSGKGHMHTHMHMHMHSMHAWTCCGPCVIEVHIFPTNDPRFATGAAPKLPPPLSAEGSADEEGPELVGAWGSSCD